MKEQSQDTSTHHREAHGHSMSFRSYRERIDLSGVTFSSSPSKDKSGTARIEVYYYDGTQESVTDFGRMHQADLAHELSRGTNVERVECHFAPTVYEGREVKEVATSVQPDLKSCKGYQWPASRLTGAEMEMLSELRERTGRPMTRLIQDAVRALYKGTIGP